jgi:selT/selW/selH-like putative selenoprotein
LAASLESRWDEKVAIAEGSRGQFDVMADDVLLFSKKETGRFPQTGEVEERYSLLKDGKELPPIPQAERKWFVSRLISRLTN